MDDVSPPGIGALALAGYNNLREEQEEALRRICGTVWNRKGNAARGSRFLRRLLARRYGNLPAWVESLLVEASLPQLESRGEALLEAKSLEEVFAIRPDRSALKLAHHTN